MENYILLLLLLLLLLFQCSYIHTTFNGDILRVFTVVTLLTGS